MTVFMRWLRAVAGVAVGLAVPAGTATWAAPLKTGSDTLKILFSGGVDPTTGLLKGSPALLATFPNGTQDTFIMDTGSTGMVVFNTGFSPPAGAVPIYTDVKQAYKSDNLLFEGDIYNILVEIGSPGNSVTADVPILFASKQRCADESRSCTKKESLRFMGVGFGEPPGGNTIWPINSSQRNPLFHIQAINGVPAQPTQGWIMASDGISVGLTATNTAGFDPAGFELLTSTTDGFNRGGATIVATPSGAAAGLPSLIDGHFNGTVLVDSGVSYAMMALDPGSPRPNTIRCPFGPKDCTDAGYTITAYLGNPVLPLIYQVITGTNGDTSASPYGNAAPDFINQLDSSTPFWNTSFHFYNAYNYLFDAESGQVAYRATAPAPAPLPLAGAAASLAWSRRLRQRLRSAGVAGRRH